MVAALTLAIGCAAASVALTGIVRRYALTNNVLDHPNERSSHVAPTPRGGGLAIMATIITALLVGSGMGVVSKHDALTLGLGIVALAVIGWIDDQRGLPARARFGVHAGVAIWTLWMYGGIPFLRIGSTSLPLGIAGYVLGTIGIVWSINLFNFMDGIDGLAASQAVLIALGVASSLFWTGDQSLGTVALILAASCAGFLAWNWPPAKIFMGDVGSGAIGYLIAGLAVASERHGAVPLIVFAIVAGVFVVDATVTLIRRMARGDRIYEAHRKHAYQRLARAWGSHRPVTIAAAGVTLLLDAVGMVATRWTSLLVPCLAGAYLLLALLFVLAERHAPLENVSA
ncbi:MAG: glycosyl transferase, group 4 family protein [Gemmatimonadetes bacterium]|nr:glycosyl transferase, group 4 family protein [Gemmatimonadota bacterium]